MAQQRIAFVGLGAMGAGMARCLVQKGFSVRGYDLRPEPVQALAAETGAVACNSSFEAAKDAHAAVVIVLTADQAQDAVFGERGLAGSLPRDAPLVCMSTMSPGRAQTLASQAAAR